MDAGFLAELRHDRRHTFLHNFLRIRLSRVDHVVNDRAAAKIGPWHFWLSLGVWLRRRHPGCMTVGIITKRLVVEIKSQLAQLPELIGDVFAGVGNVSV